MLVLTPTMFGSLLAGVALWLMFWYRNRVCPQLHRRPHGMGVATGYFREGRALIRQEQRYSDVGTSIPFPRCALWTCTKVKLWLHGFSNARTVIRT